MKNINKRLGIIIVCLLLEIATFSIGKNKKSELISTMAVPVTNKVIVVDAGHGGEDRRCGK